MHKPIVFNSKEDLYRFSELASKQDFNVYISTAYGQLDAKSLLALFTLVGEEVRVVAPDHISAKKFQNFLDEYNKL